MLYVHEQLRELIAMVGVSYRHPTNRLITPFSPSIRPLACMHTDVRIDTSLQEEDAAEKDEEDENEKKPQQPVISMNLALGPVDETLAEALEGGEGGEGGQQLTAPVEEEEEEEGKGREDDSRTRVVVSLLGVGKEEEGKREGNKEKKEEKEEEGKAKVSKKALIQELS